MKKVLSTLLAATLLLTTVTGLQGLSASAEGAAGAATSNELIANGNFENDGTVIPLDDFSDEAAAKKNWAIGRRTEANLVLQDTVLEGNKSTCLYWDNGLGREVSLKSNTTYTFNYKIRSNKIENGELKNVSNGGLYWAVSEDALVNNLMTWHRLEDLLKGTSKEGPAISAQAAGSVWNSFATTWQNGEIVFTTKTVDPDKKYYLYILSSFAASIDDCQMAEQLSNSAITAKTKEGAVISTVQDPGDENNHCLQLNKNDVLTVADFAVESNTYYKLAYNYKKVAGAKYDGTTNPNYQQLYCTLKDSSNKQIEVYNKDGEYMQAVGQWEYQYHFSAWNDNLDKATGWQNTGIIFKTGTVPSSPVKLEMSVMGGAMYADNFSVTKLVSDSEVSADFGFIGTAIRATDADTNNQQLRFKAEVNKEALTAGHYNGFTVTEYGFLAFRKDYLATRNDNLNGKLTLNVQAEKDGTTKKTTALKRAAYTAGVDGVSTADIVFSESDTAKQFYARLTGFKVENYNKTYLVRTYAKLKNAAGDELTVYVSDTTGLGVYDLAYAAFTATNSDGSYAESLETRTVLYNLLQGSSYKDSITAPQA